MRVMVRSIQQTDRIYVMMLFTARNNQTDSSRERTNYFQCVRNYLHGQGLHVRQHSASDLASLRYPNPAAFNGGTYGAAASAAAYGRGERI
jgi:hypothetical protein